MTVGLGLATAVAALTPGLEEFAPVGAVGTGAAGYATAEDMTAVERDLFKVIYDKLFIINYL